MLSGAVTSASCLLWLELFEHGCSNRKRRGGMAAGSSLVESSQSCNRDGCRCVSVYTGSRGSFGSVNDWRLRLRELRGCSLVGSSNSVSVVVRTGGNRQGCRESPRRDRRMETFFWYPRPRPPWRPEQDARDQVRPRKQTDFRSDEFAGRTRPRGHRDVPHWVHRVDAVTRKRRRQSGAVR